MKTKHDHTSLSPAGQPSSLSAQISKEKEHLVSMFLTNASIAELAEQYKRIDELNVMMSLKDNPDALNVLNTPLKITPDALNGRNTAKEHT